MQPQPYALAIVNDLFDEILDPDLFDAPEEDPSLGANEDKASSGDHLSDPHLQ